MSNILWLEVFSLNVLTFDLYLLKQSIFRALKRDLERAYLMTVGQSSHFTSYYWRCNLCPPIFYRRVWSMNFREWLWGAKPVNIPSVFMWPSLLFIWSVRLFMRSIFLLFVLLTWVFIGLTFSFNRINFYLLYGQLEFLYGQLLTFYMVTSTFYRVNFLLFISVSVKADCTYQTAYRRPGVKCRLRLKCWLKTTDQG